MSRNLCTSRCCDNIVRLSDLRGKPIEFRRYGSEPPHIGTRWDCPTCGTAYFAIWRDGIWSFEGHKWIRGFVIDLSYYESFNDEHNYDDNKMAVEVGMKREIIEHEIYEKKSYKPVKTIKVYDNYHEILNAWKQQNPGKPMPLASEPAYFCLDNAKDIQEVW